MEASAEVWLWGGGGRGGAQGEAAGQEEAAKGVLRSGMRVARRLGAQCVRGAAACGCVVPLARWICMIYSASAPTRCGGHEERS
jgi:hypothetical protein